MRRFLTILLMLVTVGLAVPLIAQESDEQQKSGFLQFIEDRISTPERRITINGLEGALSSDVNIAEITISDTEGVWLRIENAELNWDQGALLTGRLQINSLTADSIEYIRQAIPAEGIAPPSPEAPTIEVPELPVAVFLEELSVPKVIFGEELFGLGSEISVAGRLVLEGGSLDTNLNITRQDGPGGSLGLALKYDRESQNADIDLALMEPAGGVIVNLLDMDGKPDLSLQVKGSGPLSSLETTLSLDAGGKRALTGRAQLTRADTGLNITTRLNGPVADLVPQTYKSFFGTETVLAANAIVRDSGGVELKNFTIDGGELSLQARADTAADGFVNQLNLDARIAPNAGNRVLLPGGGGTTSLNAARLQIDFGNGDTWSGQLDIDNLQAGDLTAQTVKLGLSGATLNLNDPATRRITLNADGGISGISSLNPEIIDALGESMGLGIAGLWNAGEPLEIAQLRLRGKAFDLALDGRIDDLVFDGNIALTTPSIAPFSGLANRQLSGAIELAANGEVELVTGGFNLALDGTADNLALGTEIADNILVGQTRLSGRLARTAAGVAAENFQIGNAQSRITANGTFSSDAADFDFGVALSDLSLLSKNASGALTATGKAKGTNGPITLLFDADVPNGTLAGRRLADANIGFDGLLSAGDLSGELSGNAFLDGFRVDLTAGVAMQDGATSLNNLNFNAGGTQLTGSLVQSSDGLLNGKLALSSPNISIAAALLLAEAEGAATATIELTPSAGKQAAKITADIRNLEVNDASIGTANANIAIADLFGVPAIDGTLNGADIEAAGLSIDAMRLIADHQNNTTAFSGAAKLQNGTDMDVAGQLSPVGDGYSVTLDRARLAQGDLSASLIGTTALTIANETVALQDAAFDVGGGRITSSGTAGKNLNLSIDMADIPLAIANTVMPDLGLAGTLNGKLRVTGEASAPSISFDLTGNRISAAAIAPYGVTPLQINASGIFADDTLRLAAMQLDGPAGVTLRANGTMPLVGSNGNLSVTGNVPLTLANRTVGSRGTQLSGSVAIDATVSGSLAKPSFGGSITTSNAEVVDPLANLRLQSISASARLAGEQIVIEQFSGSLATGGSVSASGSVSLSASAGMPADLQINLNSARYADGNMFVATASGQLAVTGSLLRNPLLSGDVRIENAEISIPDSFDSSAVLLDVDHKAPPADVSQTLKRLHSDTGGASGTATPSVLQLNVSVSAPNQIFVRGRGVDAELGGQIQLRGNLNDIQPVGGFQLIRGRLSILGQRIVFTSGSVTLVGTLDPYIDLTARTETDSADVFIVINGPVSGPKITLSSEPELPQDEVLSLLIFQRAIGDLSPLQLAKLAAAAAELAGGSNNSLVDSLRGAAGLADLDVITDEQGNAAVRAGTYVQDNVYVSVEAGAQGDSKVSIDLDLSDSLKARGSATNDGETSVGIFYEQDY